MTYLFDRLANFHFDSIFFDRFRKMSWTLFFLLFGALWLSAQVTIWQEDFNTYPDGTTVGPDWDGSVFGFCDAAPGTWGVQGGAFVASDMEGFNCCSCGGGTGPGNCGDNLNILTIGPIDISGYCNVSVSFSFAPAGDMECIDGSTTTCPANPPNVCLGGHDQATFEYSVDGNPATLFGFYCGDILCSGGPFIGGLNGNDVTITIAMGTQSPSESYTLDDIIIEGFTGPDVVPTASTPLCEGQTLFLNEIGGQGTGWSWDGPNGFTSNAQNPSIPNITLAGDGTYFLTITDGSGCSRDTFIDVTVNPNPDITGPTFLSDCGSVTLPPITGTNLSGNEAYYTGPGGTGTSYNPGDVITTSTSLFIYDDNGGCTDEEMVTITITPGPDITGPFSAEGCGEVILPNIQGTNLTGNQAYFTGSGGTGTSYSPGDIITTTITLFMYDDDNGCSDEETINVTVYTSPDITGPFVLTDCGSVTLTAITGTNLSGTEAYYTGPGGTGTSYFPGDVINFSTTLYLYDLDANNCSDEETVEITVTPEPEITGPFVLNGCGQIVLPAITGNNLSGNEAYYTGPGGSGTVYFPGDIISNSTVLFLYDDNGNGCTDEETVDILIGPAPVITGPFTLDGCDHVVLPPITGNNLTGNEAYYELPGGNGTIYFPGDSIFGSVNLYIYDTDGNSCEDEEVVSILISGGPEIIGPTALNGCDSVELPLITGTNLSGNEAYYTATNGGGTVYFPGDQIYTSINLFIYDVDANGCSDEIIVSILLNDAPSFNLLITITACDSLVLPAITGNNLSGNEAYFSELGGAGIRYDAGQIIDSTLLLYVYDENGNCNGEDSVRFLITPSPELQTVTDTNACGLYVLPTISGDDLSGQQAYFTATRGSGTRLDPGDTLFNTTTLFLFDSITTATCADEDTFTVTIVTPPMAGRDSIHLICQTEIVDLSTLLRGVGPGGTFSDDDGTGALSGNTFNSSGITPGDYRFTYTVGDGIICPQDQATITLTVRAVPEPIAPSDAEACDFLVLPTITGNNLSGNQAYFTATQGAGMQLNPGDTVFASTTLFLFDDNGDCSGEDSWSITITPAPVADSDNATSVCQGSSVDLSTLLPGADPNGTFSDEDGTGALSGSTFNSTGIPNGDYRFTYTLPAVGSCPGDQATITVSVVNAVSAGQDNRGTVCQGDDLNLTTLLQNADAGGTFSDDDGTGALSGNTFNSSGITPGDYRFTYTVGDGVVCPQDQALITLTVRAVPEPIAPSDAEACDFLVLPTITGNNLSGNQAYFTATQGAGTQLNAGDTVFASTTLFLFDDNGDCSGEDSWSITITPAPVAGSDNATSICQGSSVDLSTLLQGADPNGTFSDEDGTGALSGSTFNSTGIPNGDYRFTYTLPAVGSCPGDQATITVSVVNAVSAGQDNQGTVCQGDNLTLTTLLQNADAGGTFSDDDGTGALSGNTFNSSGITPGDYRFTYTVGDGIVCPQDQATITLTVRAVPEPIAPSDVEACDFFVLPAITGNNLSGNQAYFTATQGAGMQLNPGDTVFASTTLFLFDDNGDCSGEDSWSITITPAPVAGSDNATSICQGSSVDLSTLLQGADPNGTFSDEDGTGALTGSTFNSTGIPNGDYRFTYTLPAVGSCPGDQATITVSVVNAVSAGQDNQGTVCQGDNLTLTTLLQNADTGGTFSDDDGTGALSGNTFNSSGITPGDYRFTYTVGDGIVCPQDQATITLTVRAVPEPIAPSDVEACDFFVLPAITGNNLSGNQAYFTATQGAGTQLNAGDTVFASTTLFLFDDNGDCSGEDSWSITITPAPVAGSDNATSVCQGSSVDLSTLLPGADPNGTFSDEDGTGALSGSTFNSTGIPNGDYRFTYTLPAVGSCPGDQATITVSVVNAVSAGQDNRGTVCQGDDLNLTTLLQNADAGGTFSDDDGTGALSGNTFNSSGITPGDYRFTYTVGDGIVCPQDQATITLTVRAVPEPIAPSDVEACDFFVLPAITGNNLSGNQAYFTATQGAGMQLNPGDTVFASTTLFLFDDNGDCSGEDSWSITITPAPVAGSDNATSICQGSSVDLSTLLQGADPNGTFADEDGTGALTGSTFNSTGIPNGDYRFTYTLPAVGSCPGDQATITVSVVDAVSAGQDNQTAVCASDLVDLSTLLIGADAGGTFTENTNSGALSGSLFDTRGLNGLYSFTYSVGDGIVCPLEESTLLVEVNAIPQPMAGSAIEACNFYTLPAISGTNLSGNEAYYTAPGGTGNSLVTGDTIFNSTTLYLYDERNGCFGEDSLFIQIATTPVYAHVSVVCDFASNTFTVTFTIEEGDPDSYTVNGVPVGSDIFRSGPIPSGSPYTFVIADANGCGNTVLNGAYDCGCSGVNAGTLDTIPVTVCEDTPALINFNNDEQLRNGDLLLFVLHDGTPNTLGNVILSNNMPEFTYKPVLQYGTTYYVAVVAGQDDGNGNIDFSDPCLSISPGVPVIFEQQLVANLGGEATICPGDTTSVFLEINVAGTIDIVVSDGTQTDTLENVANGYQWRVSPTTSTRYELLEILDPVTACIPQIPSNSVNVTVTELDAAIQVDTDYNGYGVSCSGATDGSISVTVNNGTAPYTYAWSNGSSTGTINNLPTGTYTLELTDANGCRFTLQESLAAPPSPEVFATEIPPLCFGGKDGLILLDSINSAADLSFSTDGTRFQPIQDFPVVLNNLTAGSYQILLRENDNCVTSYDFVLPEPTIRIVELGQDREIEFGERIVLRPFLNFTPDSLVWGGTLPTDCPGCTTVDLQPTESGQITLLAIDSLGCITEDILNITVDETRNVFVPNVFSPNGDGTNDHFTIFADDQQVVAVERLSIYSRWGEQVFTRTDFPANQPSEGWDGRFKGEPMNPGVFIYVADVRFFDGSVKRFQGDVTLVR